MRNTNSIDGVLTERLSAGCPEDAESCATAESSRIRTSAGSFEIKTKI